MEREKSSGKPRRQGVSPLSRGSALLLGGVIAGLHAWALPVVYGQAQDGQAPFAPSGEQLLQQELNSPPPEGGMRVRRAEPVNRGPLPVASDPVPPPAMPDASLPPEGSVPRAIPVQRPSGTPPPAMAPAIEAPPSIPPAAIPTVPLDPDDSGVPPAAIPSQAAAPVQAPPAVAAEPEPPAAPRAEPVTSSSGPGAATLGVADGFYAREMWDVALQQYAKYLSDPAFVSDPGRQTALYRAGEAALRLERVREAKIFYNTLLKEFRQGPFVGPAAYRMADFYYKEENFSLAGELFAMAADKLDQPNLALTSRYYQARCLEKMGRRTEASLAYQKVEATTGDNPYKEIAQLSLARMQVEFGNKEKALELYMALLQASPKPEIRSEATVQAGLLSAELGKTDQAVEYLNRAIEDDDQAKWKPQAVVVLLRVLGAASRYPDVISTFKKFQTTVPQADRPEMLILAATAYRRQNDFDTATRMLKEVFENYPNSPQAKEAEYQYLLGLYQAKEDGLAKRVDTFLDKNPTGQQADRAALLKAEFLFGKEDYKAAAQAYQRVVTSDLSPEIKAEGIYRQAWCYWELKDMTQAVLKFNQFIGNYPKHPLVVKALAQRALAYTQNRQFDLALGDFDRIIRQYPDAAAERELSLVKKALIQAQLNKNEDMVATFRMLVVEYPLTTSAPLAFWWIGQGTYNMRDFKSTVDAMRKARELDAKSYEERASIYVMLALFELKDITALADEVTAYTAKERQLRVPDTVVLWMGEQFYEDGKFEDAAKFLDLAVASPTYDSADSVALKLGISRYKLGQYDPAVAAFDKYLSVNRAGADRAVGLMEKARAQIGLAKYNDAITTTNEALGLQPEGTVNAEARLLLGDVKSARKDFGDAAKEYEGVAVLFDDPEITPKALSKAADAYEKAGNAAKAAELRKELSTRFPDYSASN